MATTFKYIGPVVGLALALSAPASAQAPDQQPRSPGAPPSTQRPGAPPTSQAPGQQRPDAAAQTARGEIVSVDSAGKMLTIKMADGTEQKVRYEDDTKVTGERGGLAGLAKMSGRQVVVHFDKNQSASANRVASEIQIQAADASSRTTPSTRPDGAGSRPDGAGSRPDGAGSRPDGAGSRPDAPGAPGGDRPGADK